MTVPRRYAILEGDEDADEPWICPDDKLPGVLCGTEGVNVELKAGLYVWHVWKSRPGDRRGMFHHARRIKGGAYWAATNHTLLRSKYSGLYEEYIGEVRPPGVPVAKSRLRGHPHTPFRGVPP